MDQQDDRFHSQSAQLRHQRVHRLPLVAEFPAGDALCIDQRAGSLERDSNEADLHAIELEHLVRRKQTRAVLHTGDVGGEKAEAGALELRPEATAQLRMAAARLHAPQFVHAFVELMIADCIERQPHAVHHLDGRFVLKQRRRERTGVDQIAGGHEHGVRALRAQPLHVRGEEGSAAGGLPGDAAARALGRLDVAVEVVDRQHAHLDLVGRVGCNRGPQQQQAEQDDRSSMKQG